MTLVTGVSELCQHIAFYPSIFRIEELAPASQKDVDLALQVLSGDDIGLIAIRHIRGKPAGVAWVISVSRDSPASSLLAEQFVKRGEILPSRASY